MQKGGVWVPNGRTVLEAKCLMEWLQEEREYEGEKEGQYLLCMVIGISE